MSSDAKSAPVPQPPDLGQKIKDAIVTVSMANLCFVTAWFNSLYDKDSYFNKMPIEWPALVALLLNILWLSAIIWIGFRLRHRATYRLVKLAFDLWFAGLLLIPLNFVRYDIFQIWDYQVMQFFKQPVVLFCSIVVFAVVIWAHEWVGKAARAIAAILSPLAAFTLGKAALLLLGVLHLQQQVSNPTLPPLVATQAGQPRVLWIIFDSSDYRLMFENRPPDVQLPEFDRFRNQSLSATDAVSPAGNTLWSMPGLISGHQFSDVKIAGLSDLDLTLKETGEKTTWRKLPSVFGEARKIGVNTALVGWFHPYSRVLDKDLNYCSWYPFPSFEPDRAPTLLRSMRAQVGCLLFTPHARHIFLSVCNDTLRDSLTLVTNKDYGLVLLHLPPPHTPGVYLPKEGRFTYWPMTRVTGWFNNLALADLELGQMRQAMEASGEWDKTSVIISADHSSPHAVFYDGKSDPRVPFMVKMPGANFGASYSPKINTVLTPGLILAILHGELTNQQNVVSWLDTYGKPLPTVHGGDASN